MSVFFYEKFLLYFFTLTIIMSVSANSHHSNSRRRFRANDLRMLMERERTDNILKMRGNNKTSTLNYPYVAAVIVNGRLWCAGAIVDVNWVLTAAHCLNYVIHVSPMNTLNNYVKVRVGSSHAHEGGQLMDVVGAIRHPKFEEEPVPHADVALIKLSDDIEFTEYINVIKIYDSSKEPYAQSFVVVSSWGAIRGDPDAYRDHVSDLVSARLKVRTQRYCEDAYVKVNGLLFTEDFFCASLRNGSRDACLFDAGAPAVQQNRLVGIMSFGPEQCGSENQPAVFIKAFYFRDFVKHTISAYKSPADMIKAMEETADIARPVRLHVNDQVNDLPVPVNDMSLVTKPDEKHS